MPTLQEMFDIACRHLTTMADAMIAACIVRAQVTGEPLKLPRGIHERARTSSNTRGVHASQGAPEGLNWKRMVEKNSDTRWQHV